jgi:hypothetical protein
MNTARDRGAQVGVGAWWGRDDGQVSAFVMVFLTAVLALAGLTLDGGLALGAQVRATGQAEAAARAGAQAIDLAEYRRHGTVRLLPAQANNDAHAQLSAEGATGTVTVDGETVTVAVTATYPTQLLGLVGIGSLTVHGEAHAHPQPGP